MSAIQKFTTIGLDKDVAETLVANGVTTPKQIKAMSKADLKKFGLDDKKADDLKKKFK